MSEKMYPLSIRELLGRMTEEYKTTGTVFGVTAVFRTAVHYAQLQEMNDRQAEALAAMGRSAPKLQPLEEKFLPIFGERLETPIGPAAGPHTQMTQNIVAAYVAGARFFELKTVQIMDGEDLAKCIARPCIKADDEGYNCEWSTELTVPQAYEEYVKAWCILKVISKAYGLGDPDGFIFNMSVGYDLAGIRSEKIDAFIEGLKDASSSPIFYVCKSVLKGYFPELSEYIEGISPHICRSVTLSTLHGCPPDEIERIATYLITEKRLNTFVKCNPTILGYADARAILDKAGFDYVAFDEHHFIEDLQYADAVAMFHRLIALAAENGLEFGVKLSNTFPAQVKQNELPAEEMYMSGRSLFHLTIEMARRFSAEFDGKLRISYSGGADVTNVGMLFMAGIWPITVATTVLKPGGYARFADMAKLLRAIPFAGFSGTNTNMIAGLIAFADANGMYQKPIKPMPSRKSDEAVPLFDCYAAPCQGGCPIRQDIPEYIRLTDKGLYAEALDVITQKNPLPFITGTICSHRCMTKCTRHFYDDPVAIRAYKLKAAEHGYDALIAGVQAPAPTGRKAAIIGGGAAGLSAAYFLARAGIQADVFEKEAKAGGIVRNVIPSFRISEDAIDRDIALIERMGAHIHTSTPAPSLAELKAWGYDTVIFAVGAYKTQDTGVSGNVMNVIDFLREYKETSMPNPPCSALPSFPPLGKGGIAIAIIGGGNTAMDAARAAKRIEGVEKVTIVYRRTKKYMPADEEELKEAIADGVEFAELVAPAAQADGKLTCNVMKLGEPDASGRRRPEPTGECVVIDADLVIAAIGEKVDTAIYEANGITPDARGRVPFSTVVDGVRVYNIGDSNRGPCTVVECIADAQRAADEIIGARYVMNIPADAFAAPEEVIPHKSILQEKSPDLSSPRCLSCSTVCENCVSVCPNRANTVILMPDGRREILHIDRLCNECGNCATFCPYASAPYKDKLTLFVDEEGFDTSENKGFLFLDDHTVRMRLDEVYDVDLDSPNELDKDIEVLILTVREKYGYLR